MHDPSHPPTFPFRGASAPGARPAHATGRAHIRLVLGLALLLAAGCSHDTPSSPSTPDGGSGTSLDSAFALAGQQANLTSLVVARDGQVVRQQYFHGGGRDTPQDVRSVTKSVTSLLVGVALDRGCLRSIDQTIGESLGPLGPSDPAKAAVTVRQLLSMSSGIGANELADVQEYNRWISASNQLAYVWDQPMRASGSFMYYSPAYYVLSPILTRGCGQSPADFGSANLFLPLGMGVRQWETDSQGFSNGAAGLMLTPADMVAIGNLVLNGGAAAGRQVVPADWIRNATRSQAPTAAQPYLSAYGFGWWTGQAWGYDFALANGYGGQFILVWPHARLVVTATARWQGIGTAASSQWRAIIDIIMLHVLPVYQAG